MIASKESAYAWLPPLLLYGVLAVAVSRFGTIWVAVVAALGLAATLTLARPEIATVLAVFLLYTNLAVVAKTVFPFPELLASGLALLFLIPLAHIWILRRESLRADKVFAWMWVFLILQLLSSLFATDPAIAAGHVLKFCFEGILLYFLILNVIRTPQVLRKAAGAAILAGALLGGFSLYQSVTRSYDQQFGGLAQRNLEYEIDRPVRAQAPANPGGVRLAERAAGPVGDPNRYAQMLLVLLPLAVWRLYDARAWAAKAMAALAAGLLLCGILLSYSRGAAVTLACMLLLLAFLGAIRPRHVVAGGLALVLLVPFVAPAFYDRLESLSGARGLFAQNSSMEMDRVLKGRATEMLAALHVFLDHPILGVGPGQYMPFYSEQYQLDPEIKLRHLARPRRAHNLFFEIAAEQGIGGLLVFLVMPWIAIRELWRARRAWAPVRPDLARLATAFLFSIIAYLGTGMFLHLAFERYYWFLLALAGAAVQILRTEATAAVPQTVNSRVRFQNA